MTTRDLLTPEERAFVEANREGGLEPHEVVWIGIIDRLAPNPDPVDAELVEAVCKRLNLERLPDRSFVRCVLEAAQAARIAAAPPPEPESR